MPYFHNDPVTRQIIDGQIRINLVVLLVISVPTYLATLLMPDDLPIATLFVGTVVFVAGLGLGWLFWSYAVVPWRISAFSAVPEDDWLRLDRAAVRFLLYYPDGHAFEQTERRSDDENEQINAINQRLNELYQVEIINLDFTTPTVLSLSWNRSKLLFQIIVVAFPFLLGLGGIINSKGTDFFGWLVLAIGLAGFFSIRQLLAFSFYRGIALSIDHERIVSYVPVSLVIEWTDLESLYVDDEKKELIVIHLTESEKIIQTVFRLDHYSIKNKALFKKQLKVFADRYQINLIE